VTESPPLPVPTCGETLTRPEPLAPLLSYSNRKLPSPAVNSAAEKKNVETSAAVVARWLSCTPSAVHVLSVGQFLVLLLCSENARSPKIVPATSPLAESPNAT
jgi:hypothetical protein